MRSIRALKIVAIAAAVGASLVGTATAASAATAVTSVSVKATSFAAGATSTYTVSFRATGGLVTLTPTTPTPSTITLTGLSGNLPTTPGSYVIGAQSHTGTVTAITAVPSGVQLTVPELLPSGSTTAPLAAVTPNAIVTVTVSGVTNPAAGANSVSVFTSVDTTPVTSAPFTIGGASQLVASGGNGQTTQVNSAFPVHLGASLKDSSVPPQNILQAGVPVDFTVVPGANGAGGTFANGSGTLTVNTGATGVATASILTANGTAGSFTVTATTAGLPTATFNETNSPGPVTSPSSHGYWLVGGDGGIFSFGSAVFHGSTGSLKLSRPVVGITPTPSNNGYWLDASDGGVFAFDTGFYGSIPGLGILPADYPGPGRKLAAPVVGMVPSSTGQGYFMVASDGGVFAFGDAAFEGSCPAIGGCAGAAVAVMPDANNDGYWLVTATGHVYAFGNAPVLGAPNGVSAPVTSAVRTHDGNGYWILLANGTVLPFGDATNLGGPTGLANGLRPATAIFATSTGGGYWVALSDGTVANFGDAPNDGGMNGTHLNAPIIAATGW